MPEKSLTIFFPCYNDSGTIASLVISAYDVAKSLTNDFEVIVIDDGSEDNSRQILDSLKLIYNDLKLIYHPKNKGYGDVLRSGFNSATKNYIFYTDGDGQFDVYELKRLYRCLNKDVDVVNGYKIFRNDPLHRILIGKTYLFLTRLIFNYKSRDVDCDFRLIKRSIIKEINLKQKSGVVCLELIKKLENINAVFIEIPVNHYFRTHGKSQFFNFKRISEIIFNIFVLYFNLLNEPRFKKVKKTNNKNPSLLNKLPD